MSSKLPMPHWMRSHAGPAGRDYLSEEHFFITIGAAVLLHLVALYVWHLVPVTQIIDIPVRVLSIKLGDDTAPVAQEEAAPPAPETGNNSEVENTLSRLVRDQDPSVQIRQQSVTKSMDKAMNKAAKGAVPKAAQSARKSSTAARQYVRSTTAQTTLDGAVGTPMGNASQEHAAMISRYEQLISLWIQKFKIYPPDARAQGMQGETMVRIRIDRQGNIRYYVLENSTGSQALDRAAIDMIRRANPVPAVPNDYPPGEMLEFLIPVTFRLQ